jgi:SSS family solute:Na+ symporter
LINVALVIIFGWLLATTVVGIMAGRNRAFSMEEYFVAGRSFGLILFYTTAAAEIYSSFAFLGLAGWAYSKGMSITYALAYGSIAYAIYFLLGPRINRLGKRMNYISQPDYLEDRYGSRGLGVLAAIIGVVFIIPYLQLQIMGSGMIVQLASGGAISWQWAVLISFVAAVIFVYVSGLRGIGWTNFMQAIIMLVGMASVGFLVSRNYFGGVGRMFETLAELRPTHLVLPDTSGNGMFWYASTALLSGLGFWMWPHLFAATYSAKDENVVRRNAVILPLYQLAMVPVIIVGFAVAAKGAVDPSFGLKIAKPDHAMFVALLDSTPPWVVGLLGAGGLAASISTSSGLILTAANLTARNIMQKGLLPRMTDMQVARAGRGLVVLYTVVALVFAFLAPSMLVNLLIVGYSGITQFFPGVVLGVFSERPTKWGVISGLVVGLSALFMFQFGGIKAPFDLQPGFVGLILNFATVWVVSAFTEPVDDARLNRFKSALSDGEVA